MTTIPEPLSFKDQLAKFQTRGMDIPDLAFAENMIQEIGYYRLKEAAYPLARVIDKNLTYSGVKFEAVITRYLQDKNLRIYLLHSIEEIEVSIKTKVSHILGLQGAFTYLDFFSWCNRQEYCKYYLKDRQEDFKRRLSNKMRTSTSRDLREKQNINQSGFPTVWLAMDILTFGDVLYLLELMSNNNLRSLSNYYRCTPNELLSWLKCLKFVRNICAHNSNIIDIKLVTTPKIVAEWHEALFQYTSGKYTDRIAVVLCIIKKMMVSVNPNYNFNKIYAPVSAIISRDEKIARNLGFKDDKSLTELFPKQPTKSAKFRKPW